MKILHISTNDTGGAATATIRIHESLLKIGVVSTILFLNKVNYSGPYGEKYDGVQNNQLQVPEKPTLTLKNYLVERFFHSFSNEEDRIKNILFEKHAFKLQIEQDTLKKFEVFSTPYSDYDITTTEAYKNADIIHLHWAAGFLDFPSFFIKNTKPVVFSMHDENYILGAFHYEGDSIRNSAEYGQLDTEYLKIKKESYARLSNFSVITGSNWVREKVLNSSVFGTGMVRKIHYPVNPSRHRYLDSTEAKNMLNLSSEKKVFLFASENVSNYRKGFDLLETIIEHEDFQDVLFLVMGRPNQKFDRENVVFLGRIMDEITMPIVYAASDFYILPSREENFSYAMIESLCCGTPSLAFNVGDHKSFLEDNQLGWTANEVSSIGLMEILVKAKNNQYSFDRREVATRAITFFDELKVANQFLDVYKALN
jgi:glycosyltransferase involved in cell wall biosynthesis